MFGYIQSALLRGKTCKKPLDIRAEKAHNYHMNTFEVETDTKIAEAYGVLMNAAQSLRWAQDSLIRAAGDRYLKMPVAEAKATVEANAELNVYSHGYNAKDTLVKYAEAYANYRTSLTAYNVLNGLYTGWSRFFLVTNTNGHVHSSMSCSTCFATTTFGWLPQLSGLTEAEAVADQGEILCSVCFPSAPVAWTTGVSKASTEARDARKAKSDLAAAKKAEKSLGTVLRVGRWNDRIETIAAAKKFLTDEFEYARCSADDTFLVAETLAARLGTTAAEELAAASTRAAKRNR